MAEIACERFERFDELVQRLRAFTADRSIVAVAGPPGGGKSTLSGQLADALNAADPGIAAVVPMDGFHYDDVVLEERGLKARKGSPPTFDVAGLGVVLRRLRKNNEAEVAVPVFDRSLELSRASARIVPRSVRIVIVEGLYLLLKFRPWSTLLKSFDLTIMVTADQRLLEERLVQRWLSYGFDMASARHKVVGNDLPNLELVMSQSREPDLTMRSIKRPY